MILHALALSLFMTLPAGKDIAYQPQPGPQTEYHRRNEDIVGYGGTKGPGKTHALLGEAARQIPHPDYHGILFRRTYPQLQEIIDRGTKLYQKIGGKWKGDLHRWHFPSGSIVSTGHCQHEKDVENWNGKEFAFMGVDQGEQFTKYMINYLMAQNRVSVPGLNCAFNITFNPGGIGNAWIKDMFIKNKVPGQTYTLEFPMPDGTKVSRTYTFIKGTVHDNKILLKNNPQYLAVLASMPEKLRRAFLLGDFDALSGQYFDTWMDDVHAVEPFQIPKEWQVYMAMDWGYDKELVCHWWAVAPNGAHVYCFREYVTTRTISPTAGAAINAINEEMFGKDYIRENRIKYFYVDPSIFATGGQTGKTIADDFQLALIAKEPDSDGRKARVLVVPADNSRVAGWGVFRNMLAIQIDGLPFAMWFKTCKYAIETIPTLVHDEHKTEDLDSDGADHAADADRYFFIERFGAKKIEEKKPWASLTDNLSRDTWADIDADRKRRFGRNSESDLPVAQIGV